MASVLPPSLVDQPVAQIPASAFPAEIELVPGALRASIHLHTIDAQAGPLRCWSYVTAGLAAFGQKEVVFTIAVDGDADPGRFPTEPLRFATTLLQLASQGRTVDAGAITELGGSGFMLRRGLTYARALPLAGVPLPPAALAAIPLTAEELSVLKIGGQTRVLAALGAAATLGAADAPGARGDALAPARIVTSVVGAGAGASDVVEIGLASLLAPAA